MRIRSFFWSVLSPFGLNIRTTQSTSEKIQTTKTPNTDTFHAVFYISLVRFFIPENFTNCWYFAQDIRTILSTKLFLINKNSKFYLIGFDPCSQWQIIMSKISLRSWCKNENTLPQSNLMVLIKIYLLCFFNQFLAIDPILHPLKDVFRRYKMKT